MNFLPQLRNVFYSGKLLSNSFYLIISFLQYLNAHVLLQDIIIIRHPPWVSSPARYAKNARSWPFFIQPICQSFARSEQPWQKSNVSPLDQEQVHLLHARKAADSQFSVPRQKHTHTVCSPIWTLCIIPMGSVGTEEPIQSMLMFTVFVMPLLVVQESLVFCQHQGNNNRITISLG